MEITLNRPERLNAFNDEMHLAIQESLDQAADPKIRAVVLTGAGRGFCAGQDLNGRDPRKMDGPPDLGETLNTLYNPLVQKLRNLAKPVICAVNGIAAGAGANIVFSCDASSTISMKPPTMKPPTIGKTQSKINGKSKLYLFISLPYD